MHEEQEKRGDCEENAVHDTERKTCFQHRARLVEIDGKWARCTGTFRAYVYSKLTIGAEARAALAGNAAKLVDASDKGPDETDVDKGDEDGGFAGRFAAQDGGDCPSSSQDGDDEEGKDRGGCELVPFGKAMNEPSQHA